MSDCWRRSNVINAYFGVFLVPTGSLLQGWHLSESQNDKRCWRFDREKLLHTEASTQRSLYTEQPLHTKLFQTEAFARRSISTQQFLQSVPEL